MGIKTIGVIGCGNMGSAIVRGLTSGIYANGIRILINDALAEKSVALAEDSNSEVSELQELVKMSDIVIIAIKPQDSQAVFERIEAHITARKLVISVMAGVKISEISKGVGRDVPIVRAMPNMPGIIGAGITCLSYNSLVRDQELVNNIFRGIGKVIEVEEEKMDIITAISGSGPAYFFYFADALIKAAVSNGLSETEAKELIFETISGSAALLKDRGLNVTDLIASVASKGGTTEAALSVFSDKKMDEIISAAVKKARQRSKELSQE